MTRTITQPDLAHLATPRSTRMASVTPTDLPGVVVLAPRVHRDGRGHFFESWSRGPHAAAGLPARFVQDNVSVSTAGVLRGLHLQSPGAQGKLVTVLRGAIYDVAVDVRVGSPTYLRWVGVTLDDRSHHQLYIPPGFAHGFAVVGDEAVVHYKCTTAYRPECELTIRWDDPEIRIRWPLAAPTLSPKDAAATPIAGLAAGRLPRFDGRR